MEEIGLSDTLDLLSGALDGVRALLAGVGIDVGPGVAQIILLALLLAALYGLRGRYFPLKTAKLDGLVLGVALAAASVLVLVNWANLQFNPPPDHVRGIVEAEDRNGLRVELLDFNGMQVPRGSAPVDSQNGLFVIRYERAFGDWPRQVRVSKSGCRDSVTGITLSQLRSGQDIRISFQCEEVS